MRRYYVCKMKKKVLFSFNIFLSPQLYLSLVFSSYLLRYECFLRTDEVSVPYSVHTVLCYFTKIQFIGQGTSVNLEGTSRYCATAQRQYVYSASNLLQSLDIRFHVPCVTAITNYIFLTLMRILFFVSNFTLPEKNISSG